MIVHLNGQLLPRQSAFISPFDRGFVFGDAVYEGLRAVPSSHPDDPFARAVAIDLHIHRIRQALALARFALADFRPDSLIHSTRELLRANNLPNAFVYWQISRGTPSGDEPVRLRLVPPAGLRSGLTVFGYCSPQPSLDDIARAGPPSKRVWVVNDPRWALGHIKSTSLMGNCLAAIEADRLSDHAADDVLLVRDGFLAEGLATNVVIVTHAGEIATPSLDSTPILAGVTRALLLHLCPDINPRPIHAHELFTAREVLLCGSSTMIQSVSALNTSPLTNPSPGPVAKRLLNTLLQAIHARQDLNLPIALIQGSAWTGFPAPHNA